MDIRTNTEKLIDKTNKNLEHQTGDVVTVHIDDTVQHNGPFLQ